MSFSSPDNLRRNEPEILSLLIKDVKVKMKTKEQLLSILDRFRLEEKAVSAEPFGNGHINDTLGVATGGGEMKYILQRINHHIFTDVDMLQNNIHTVTTHIRRKLEERGETDIARKVLTLVPARDGKLYHFDGSDYWRVCLFIPRSKSYEEVTPAKSYEAGKAFGDFQSMLADVPEGALGEIIPGFHNMEFRLQQFREALAADAAGRAAGVKDLIDEVEKRSRAMCIQEDLYREGKLKKRVNHCDTKVNNILFDEDGKVLCVIDLDTVMPGFVLSDIGDFIRTGANTGAEDDRDTTRIGVNMEVFEAYTRGYMETARSFLTPLEISLLPYGGRLLTYMQTVRFLTDYINGDTYYKIHYPGHNLVRTQAQFKLLQSLEARAEEMEKFMQEWLT
jgi:Ser/Thr protein kinase RdoA (MazF antagonist)